MGGRAEKFITPGAPPYRRLDEALGLVPIDGCRRGGHVTEAHESHPLDVCRRPQLIRAAGAAATHGDRLEQLVGESYETHLGGFGRPALEDVIEPLAEGGRAHAAGAAAQRPLAVGHHRL